MQNNSSSKRIIGGMFGLQVTPDPDASNPPFLQDRSITLDNARSGIWLLVNKLAPQQVWCPSYLCNGILDAVMKSSAKVRFYEVNYDLKVSSLDWLDQMRQGDLVILIDYFGFNIDSNCTMQAKERDAWILEDASQALLSGKVGQFSDFVVYSPRKFVGVPDGGILFNDRDDHFQEVNLEAPPAEWWLRAFLASLLRREFDIHGGTRAWFELFQKTEPDSPIGPFAMSELSMLLLKNSFDYSTIARRRVDNYRALADKLGSLAIYPNLPDGIVPLGFPIRTKERDRVRQVLFANEIYPPVHWLIQGVVPEEYKESHRLASEIMTLPCDQRYDRNDMDWIIQVVAEALGW
jgi:hypothetical protein